MDIDGRRIRAAMICEQEYESYPGQAPCPHCFESSGYAARIVSATWTDPSYAESDPCSPCPYCETTGTVDSELVTLADLEWRDQEEMESVNPIWTPATPERVG